MRKRPARLVALIAGLTLVAAVPLTAQGNNAWGNYHWARTANPFTIKVIDSMTADWDTRLNLAISDWSASSVMDVVKENGDSGQKTRKRCATVTGKVRACNANYGFNGWLGVAQIWLNGSHIVKGTAKMNDSYLASGYTETNKQHVICQELGHDWGLDHQDESGADLNTCMDYDNNLSNPSPDQHDYAQLEAIYAHLDSTTTIASLPVGSFGPDPRADAAWGRKVAESANGRSAWFVRELGRGFRVLTHVTWVQ